MRGWHVLAGIFLALIAATASATDSEPTRAWLVTQPDADALVAAALLTDRSRPVDAVLLLERAAALEPRRADLVWLQLQLCPAIVTCNAEPLEHRLLLLDPDNGAPYFSVAARAKARGDQDARSAALLSMAASQHVDLYWNTLVARLSRAVERAHTESLSESVVDTAGLLVARVIPPFNPITAECLDDRLRLPERLEVCRGIAATFQRGDTVVVAMLGDAMAMRLWPQESPPHHAAEHARQEIHEQMEHWVALDAWMRAHPAEYLALLDGTRREQDAMHAAMSAADTSRP